MANENRFSGLMGGLGQSDSSEPEKAEVEGKASLAAASKAKRRKAAAKPKKAKYEDKENYKQVGLYLPVEVHRKMKIGAAMTGKEMSEIAAEGVQLWLKKNTPNI